MSTKIIKINRGDSFDFEINVSEKNNINKIHLLNSNEAVYFALLYPHQRFEEAIILKGYTLEDQDINTGDIKIKITPNDTKYLTPGVYYYTVKFQRGGSLDFSSNCEEPEEVRTIIERTKFIINE
jgi:hypothetical protein